jgi:hypothetical protein
MDVQIRIRGINLSYWGGPITNITKLIRKMLHN